MTKEMIIKRLRWAIEDKDWDAVNLLVGDLEELKDEIRSDEWVVKQYNRNRSLEEKITDVKESCIGYGVIIYEGRIEEDKVLFTAEDVY